MRVEYGEENYKKIHTKTFVVFQRVILATKAHTAKLLLAAMQVRQVSAKNATKSSRCHSSRTPHGAELVSTL